MADQALEGGKKRLLEDIKALQSLADEASYILSKCTFGDLCGTKSLQKLVDTWNDEGNNSSSELINSRLQTHEELYSLAGFQCTKMEQIGGAFIFRCWDGAGFESAFGVQLQQSTHSWKLGKWTMPRSIDARKILAKYSLDSKVDAKYFLRDCKRHVDRWNRRRQQFQELEAFMETLSLYNFCLSTDDGYQRIIMKLYAENSLSIWPIVVYFFYNSNETQITKMSFDRGGNGGEMSREETKKFRAYFKPFKNHDLKKAAEKIFSSDQSASMWRRESKEEEIFNSEEEMEENLVTQILKKRKDKKPKSRDKNTSKGSPNEDEGNPEGDLTGIVDEAFEEKASEGKKRKRGRKKLPQKQDGAREKKRKLQEENRSRMKSLTRENGKSVTNAPPEVSVKSAKNTEKLDKTAMKNQPKVTTLFALQTPLNAAKNSQLMKKKQFASTPIVSKEKNTPPSADISDILMDLGHTMNQENKKNPEKIAGNDSQLDSTRDSLEMNEQDHMELLKDIKEANNPDVARSVKSGKKSRGRPRKNATAK